MDDFWQTETFGNLQHETSMRFTPYIVGVIFGFYIDHMNMNKLSLDKLSKPVLFTLWTIPCVVTLFLMVVSFTDILFYVPDEIAVEYFQYLDNSVKTIAGLSIGWITLACYFGRGGILNKFLSCKLFRVGSKLCFVVYLVHSFIQTTLLHMKGKYSTLEMTELVSIYCKRFTIVYYTSML